MPNWCSNQLAVRGPAEDVQRFKERAVGHSPWLKPEEIGGEAAGPLNFHSLVPVPEELVKAGYNEAAYNWEREHWGCKWGACAVQVIEDEKNCVIYAFDTAWVPPIKFIERVARDWPTLSLVLEHGEPGNGFQGLAKAQGGKLEDFCVDH